MSNTENTQLKVLLIASGDLWAGAEVQVYYLAQALQQRKHINIHVVLMNDFTLSQKLQSCGIEVTILDEAKLSSIQILRQLINLTSQIRPNIIHTHRQKENIFGSIASLFCKNCHCLRTQHGDEEHFPRFIQFHKIIYQLLNRFCGKYVQEKIIAVSDDLAIKLESHYPPKKIVTVYNGININEVKRRANEPSKPLPGNPGARKLGIFARLVDVKRIDIFIEIAEKLQALQPNQHSFYIFGDGPLDIEIRKMIEVKNLSSTVFTMGHQENAYPYIASMDLILITSNHEGLPMNLLEAMCLKTAVIAHAVGGIPAALEHGRSGILIYQNHPDKYVEKIIDSEIQNNLDSIVENAYNNCINNYSSDQTCQKTLELYISLLA